MTSRGPTNAKCGRAWFCKQTRECPTYLSSNIGLDADTLVCVAIQSSRPACWFKVMVSTLQNPWQSFLKHIFIKRTLLVQFSVTFLGVFLNESFEWVDLCFEQDVSVLCSQMTFLTAKCSKSFFVMKSNLSVLFCLNSFSKCL